MAQIQFKAKIQTMDPMLGGYDYIAVPELKRSHCDMNAFRSHSKYGSYANSDLFAGMLARIRRDTFGERGRLRLDDVPSGVTVDTSGFLAVVTFEV